MQGRCAIGFIMLLASAPALGGTPGQDYSAKRDLTIQGHVSDLMNDEVRFNATDAIDMLGNAGETARPFLQAALTSNDWQQRQIAAWLLCRLTKTEPSEDLIRVLVEALASDELPYQYERLNRPRRYTYVANARSATWFLLRHGEVAEVRLAEALNSRNAQQRFLSAFILGTTARSNQTAGVCGVLIPHLSDNDVEGDALMAGAALYRLGPSVEPYLKKARVHADRQSTELIDLILLDLHDPPDTPEKLRGRSKYHNVTNIYHDPVYELRGWSNGFHGIDRYDR